MWLAFRWLHDWKEGLVSLSVAEGIFSFKRKLMWEVLTGYQNHSDTAFTLLSSQLRLQLFVWMCYKIDPQVKSIILIISQGIIIQQYNFFMKCVFQCKASPSSETCNWSPIDCQKYLTYTSRWGECMDSTTGCWLSLDILLIKHFRMITCMRQPQPKSASEKVFQNILCK